MRMLQTESARDFVLMNNKGAITNVTAPFYYNQLV